MPNGGRRVLDEELARLVTRIGHLADRVDEALGLSIRALLNGDVELGAQVVADDETINGDRGAIERDCVAVFATQQPAGTDVRFLPGVLELSTESERMGDYAKGIAGAAHGGGEWLPVFERGIPRSPPWPGRCSAAQSAPTWTAMPRPP